MPAPGKALLFDMDGVLVESLASYRDAWTRWATRYQVTREAIAADVHGRRPEEVIARVLPGVPLAVALEAFDTLMDAGTGLVVPMPGARELTARLPPGRWAIVTSTSRRHAVPMLAAARLTVPAQVVYGDDITRGKPDPSCFLLGAERLGMAPSECVVVEDAPAGLEAARAAGMAAVAVATTHRPDQLTGADRIFPSLAEASDYLLSLVAGEDRPSGGTR